jgi:hypothetical protein
MIDCDDERQEREAQDRVSLLAMNLSRLFGPVDAAGLMAGGMIGVMTAAYGRKAAIAYVKGLLEEMSLDELGRDGPNLMVN